MPQLLKMRRQYLSDGTMKACVRLDVPRLTVEDMCVGLDFTLGASSRRGKTNAPGVSEREERTVERWDA